MAGLYFLAAGTSSKNREKSLDQGFRLSELLPQLVTTDRAQVELHAKGEPVYAWGANRIGDLDRLSPGDYVVDVKNKKVVQVFQYALAIETQDDSLQQWIGWDEEKPRDKARPYRFVFFLIRPQKTSRDDKTFFQRAFDQEKNQNWLVGQRWFSPEEVTKALARVNANSLESFLGIESDGTRSQMREQVSDDPRKNDSAHEALVGRETAPVHLRPDWLTPVIEQVEWLRHESGHLERQHEDAVARLFEALGYDRTREIQFQRGRVDVRIALQGRDKPNIIIEVKRDWALSRGSKDYLKQLHSYALESGARRAILTNGDTYIVFDRSKGFSYDDQFESEFRLTELSAEGLGSLMRLARSAVLDVR